MSNDALDGTGHRDTCSQLQPITLDILRGYSWGKTQPSKSRFCPPFLWNVSLFLFRPRLRIPREFSKRQTILLNFTENLHLQQGRVAHTFSAPVNNFEHISFCVYARHCEPFSQFKDYFPAAPDLPHCPLILIQSLRRCHLLNREKTPYTVFFFFLPTWKLLVSSVYTTPWGNISLCRALRCSTVPFSSADTAR